jgi:hypothetical protein
MYALISQAREIIPQGLSLLIYNQEQLIQLEQVLLLGFSLQTITCLVSMGW